MQKQQPPITLIGAGLVGSLLAVLLARRGFRVEIFERRPDLRCANISAGRSINLALANRGIYPLEQAGLMDSVSPILTPMKGRMVHDINGKENFQPYGQKPEEVIYSVSRGDLNALCMDAAEATGLVKIHFNQHCQKVDLKNHQIQIEDQLSGKTITSSFKRLIGTDGSSSAVREAIHQTQSKQHEVIPLGHSYKELCIPAAADGTFQLDSNSLHIWPRGGFMLIALPNQDSSFTVTLFMPNEGEISFASLNSTDKLTQFFEHHFAEVLPLIPQLTEAFFDNPTGRLATVKCNPWHIADQALILGDAAHAVVPFHGQGMNCGFEDALDLVETIDRIGDDWNAIFSAVESQRKMNADAIADMAIENYITMRDSVTNENYLLQNALAFELEKRFPDYFCPRYALVMFHRIPYAEAKSRGSIQQTLLVRLLNGLTDIKEVDFKLAEAMIKQQLSPIIWR